MKKQGSVLLLMLTLAFFGFSLGFFVGRNQVRTPVQVSTSLISNSSAAQAASAAETQALSPQVSSDYSERININTADQQTLMLLPGIGDVLSQRIIDYRDSNGPFQTVAELTNVSGIGESRLEAILPFVTVGG